MQISYRRLTKQRAVLCLPVDICAQLASHSGTDELLSLSSRRHEQGQVLHAGPGTAERGLRQIDQQSLQVVMKI